VVSRLETADSVARAHELDTAEAAAVRAQVGGLDRLAARPVERAEHATDGEETAARAQYRAARAQLAAGAALAREFRTPDPDPVERKRSEVAWKLDVLAGRDTTSAIE
jgi:hypothetical protein